MTTSFLVHQHQVSLANQRFTIVSILCEALTKAGFVNAFSTRGGGVSSMPSNSLNFSNPHDHQSNIRENKRRFLESLHIGGWPLILGRQTHSDKRVFISERASLPNSKIEADAFMTRRHDIVIGVKSADCVPVLIADPVTGLCAAVHAGWRGTLARITQKTVANLLCRGARPQDMLAVMGPSACEKCYEVGNDVYSLFMKEFREAKKLFHQSGGHAFTLNTVLANRFQLLECGLNKRRIFEAPFCTIHHPRLFFSHRRESKLNKVVGRHVAVIGRMSATKESYG